jgi:hypothetical protein
LFEDFIAKAEREDAFTLIVENEILHEIRSDNGVIVLAVNFALPDNLIFMDTTFLHCNIHEPWSSLVDRTQIEHNLVCRRQLSDV